MKKLIQFLSGIRIALIALSSLTFTPLSSVAQDEINSLDGKSYAVSVQKAGEELFINENIEFADGNFESTFMEDKGYEKAKYTAYRDGNLLRWKATSMNKAGDSLTWEGSESQGNIQGTITSKEPGTTWSFKNSPR